MLTPAGTPATERMRCLLAVSCCVLVGACGSGARVEIANGTSHRLQAVTVAAGGSAATVDLINPESATAVSICPQGEVGDLDLRFELEGRSVQQRVAVYFECDASYVVHLRVARSDLVEASVRLR